MTIKFVRFICLISSIIVLSCGQPSEVNEDKTISTKKPAELIRAPESLMPVPPAQEILAVLPDTKFEIESDEKLLKIKRSVVVRLNEKITEAQLQQIANRIKSSEAGSYERTFIEYYLPDMKVGNGAWATTHFNPGLDIKVHGMALEQAEQFKLPENIKSENVIGSWEQGMGDLSHIITFHKKDKKVFANKMFKDGTFSDTKLVIKKIAGDKRYIEKGNERGEYYLITPDGRLQSFDPEGLIETLSKAN